MILASKLYETYRSYFSSDETLDEETKDKIDEWVDRDMAWANKEAKKLEQEPRNIKVLSTWSGTAKQLLRILKLRK